MGKIETILGVIPREPLKSIVILGEMYALEIIVPILSDMAEMQLVLEKRRCPRLCFGWGGSELPL